MRQSNAYYGGRITWHLTPILLDGIIRTVNSALSRLCHYRAFCRCTKICRRMWSNNVGPLVNSFGNRAPRCGSLFLFWTEFMYLGTILEKFVKDFKQLNLRCTDREDAFLAAIPQSRHFSTDKAITTAKRSFKARSMHSYDGTLVTQYIYQGGRTQL